MIKTLDNFSELTFPIVTMKKVNNIYEDRSYLYYDGQALLKQHDLFSTFNINIPFLPVTYHYVYNPESLLVDPSILSGKLIVDTNLNIFLPIKKLKLTYKTSIFVEKLNNYIKITDCPHYIPEIHEKSAKYPLICIVEGCYFLVGWENTKVKQYEAFI